jgi:hypothetical protein
MRVVLAEKVRAHTARGIATLRAVFDLDDLGAEVGEVHRTEGACAEGFEGEDAQSSEG